jgi:hypothetical protein
MGHIFGNGRAMKHAAHPLCTSHATSLTLVTAPHAVHGDATAAAAAAGAGERASVCPHRRRPAVSGRGNGVRDKAGRHLGAGQRPTPFACVSFPASLVPALLFRVAAACIRLALSTLAFLVDASATVRTHVYTDVQALYCVLFSFSDVT